MRVRLVRKLANWIDGIDLRHCGVGDLVDLPERQARIMTVERWAVLARRAGDLVVSTDSEEPLASAFAEGRRLHGDRRRSSRLNDLYQRLRDKKASGRCPHVHQDCGVPSSRGPHEGLQAFLSSLYFHPV